MLLIFTRVISKNFNGNKQLMEVLMMFPQITLLKILLLQYHKYGFSLKSLDYEFNNDFLMWMYSYKNSDRYIIQSTETLDSCIPKYRRYVTVQSPSGFINIFFESRYDLN